MKQRGREEARSDRDRVIAVQGRRRSNAAGSHGDRRTKRLRTRSAVRVAALRDW
jgi:hypothetical protein